MLSVFQLSPREVDQEQAPGHSSPCLLPETQQIRREPPLLGMDYLSVPPALAWGRTRASAHSPLFRRGHTSPHKHCNFKNTNVSFHKNWVSITLLKINVYTDRIIHFFTTK